MAMLGLRGRERVIRSKCFSRKILLAATETGEKGEREMQGRRPQSRGTRTGPGHAGVTRQGHTGLTHDCGRASLQVC